MNSRKFSEGEQFSLLKLKSPSKENLHIKQTIILRKRYIGKVYKKKTTTNNNSYAKKTTNRMKLLH